MIQGRLDFPLSKLGQEQAQKLSDWLKLVPIDRIYSSPLKRAQDTASAICAQQPKANLHIDDRLTATGAGEAEGEPWEEVKDKLDEMGREPVAEVRERLHSWLSSLITAHTPQTSGAVTPITPVNPASYESKPVFERALSSTKGLPRPGMIRKPSKEFDQSGKGVVLAVTHQECIMAILDLLISPIITPDRHDEQSANTPINLHIPEHFEFVQFEHERKVGNTAVAIVRIWWEESVDGEGLEVRGRLEAWGSEEHLQD
nr:uncharacterized protein I206_00438 [Kwoniella pini CBS 10737]OCF53137.1 hypothetical protein I206_00438 [Kwoniella pini CBS 10737]